MGHITTKLSGATCERRELFASAGVPSCGIARHAVDLNVWLRARCCHSVRRYRRSLTDQYPVVHGAASELVMPQLDIGAQRADGRNGLLTISQPDKSLYDEHTSLGLSTILNSFVSILLSRPQGMPQGHTLLISAHKST
jgi:hypothetical protein